MKKKRWTIRVILTSNLIDMFEGVETQEEMNEFTNILATEAEIIEMLKAVKSNDEIVTLKFPEGYDILQFDIPRANLLHITTLQEKKRKGFKHLSRIAERIISND